MQQAFEAERQYLVIATKAKKPDMATCMELLKDLQAAMEKVDEVRQHNREPALRDPLSMVADGVGALGWVTAEPPNSKPHEFIRELFGGAQMYGNKVLKEYKEKYVVPPHITNSYLTLLGRTKLTSSGYKPTTRSSRHWRNMQRSITSPLSHGIRMA